MPTTCASKGYIPFGNDIANRQPIKYHLVVSIFSFLRYYWQQIFSYPVRVIDLVMIGKNKV